jgi:hypothetical protein
MRAFVSTILFAVTCAASAAPAFAEEPEAMPAFALMDNTGDRSKINLDLADIIPMDSHADNVLVRSSILGQYVASNGFGGYAGITASGLLPEGDMGTGNLELGGVYHRALSSNVDFGVRAGLVLPTERVGKDRLPQLIQLVSTLIARPSDLATAVPDATWLRFGISPTYHRGPAFLRVDLGLDVPVRDHSIHGFDPIGHLNLGAGIRNDGFTATAELQTVFVRWGTNIDDPMQITSYHTAGLSARYQGKRVSPFVSVSTPLDDEVQGQIITVTAGLTIPF